MVKRGHHEEILATEQGHIESSRCSGCSHYGEVYGFFLHHLLEIGVPAFDQLHPDPRIVAVKLGKQTWEHIRGYRWIASHPHLACLDAEILLQHSNRLVGSEQYVLNKGEEDLGLRSEGDGATLALEQVGPQLLFQPAHLIAQRRL